MNFLFVRIQTDTHTHNMHTPNLVEIHMKQILLFIYSINWWSTNAKWDERNITYCQCLLWQIYDDVMEFHIHQLTHISSIASWLCLSSISFTFTRVIAQKWTHTHTNTHLHANRQTQTSAYMLLISLPQWICHASCLHFYSIDIAIAASQLPALPTIMLW